MVSYTSAPTSGGPDTAGNVHVSQAAIVAGAAGQYIVFRHASGETQVVTYLQHAMVDVRSLGVASRRQDPGTQLASTYFSCCLI